MLRGKTMLVRSTVHLTSRKPRAFKTRGHVLGYFYRAQLYCRPCVNTVTEGAQARVLIEGPMDLPRLWEP